MNTNKNSPKKNKSGSIKILITDDDQRTRNGLRALLESAHLTATNTVHRRIELVGEASNGHEALQKVETTHPDIVLMDVQMQKMDGIQATRKIKAIFPGIKIIILTVRSASRTAALEAGADAFLIKGGATKELVDCIYSFQLDIGHH
jgi:DNA-binding NarL/FixJ family response regulator